MPQVSVIIPTYDRAAFVVKALQSVLTQSFTDREIIVVDDGSRDNTRAVLEPYRDRIRYLYQENAGVSAARNAGIRAATGEWLAFLDSDDEWRQGYLAAQMGSARLHPQAVAHVTNSVSLSPGAPPVEHFREVRLLGRFKGEERVVLAHPFRTVVGSSHWFLQPIVMRREALLKAGLFNPVLTIAEDMDVVARLSLRGPFTFLREVLVEIYRREEETASLSAQYLKRGIYSRKSFAKVFADLFVLPELTCLERVVLCRELGSVWRALGNVYLQVSELPQARRSFLQSLLVYPSPRALVKYLAACLPAGVARLAVRKKMDVVPGDEAELR